MSNRGALLSYKSRLMKKKARKKIIFKISVPSSSYPTDSNVSRVRMKKEIGKLLLDKANHALKNIKSKTLQQFNNLHLFDGVPQTDVDPAKNLHKKCQSFPSYITVPGFETAYGFTSNDSMGLGTMVDPWDVALSQSQCDTNQRKNLHFFHALGEIQSGKIEEFDELNTTVKNKGNTSRNEINTSLTNKTYFKRSIINENTNFETIEEEEEGNTAEIDAKTEHDTSSTFDNASEEIFIANRKQHKNASKTLKGEGFQNATIAAESFITHTSTVKIKEDIIASIQATTKRNATQNRNLTTSELNVPHLLNKTKGVFKERGNIFRNHTLIIEKKRNSSKENNFITTTMTSLYSKITSTHSDITPKVEQTVLPGEIGFTDRELSDILETDKIRENSTLSTPVYEVLKTKVDDTENKIVPSVIQANKDTDNVNVSSANHVLLLNTSNYSQPKQQDYLNKNDNVTKNLAIGVSYENSSNLIEITAVTEKILFYNKINLSTAPNEVKKGTSTSEHAENNSKTAVATTVTNRNNKNIDLVTEAKMDLDLANTVKASTDGITNATMSKGMLIWKSMSILGN